MMTRTLLLQPTSYCSLDCSYCYLRNRAERNSMSVSTARAAVRWIEQNGLNQGGMSILWHSGEPLSLPEEYFREVFAAVRSELNPEAPAVFELQTNAISVSDRFCELFCEYDVSVGVSLDGPASMHDARRRTRTGHGTHAASSRGLALLQKWGMDPVVFCVVTEDSLAQPLEFVDYFESLGIKMLCLNFDEIKGANRSSSLDLRSTERLQCFLEVVYERCRTSSYFAVREFHNIHNRLAQAAEGRDFKNVSEVHSPLAMVSVNWEGKISTFSPELLDQDHPLYGQFIFGDVFSQTAEEVLSHPTLQAVHRDIRVGLDACQKSCGYFNYCGGGVPSNKLGENGSFASTVTRDCTIRVPTVLRAISRSLQSSAS